MHHTQEPLTRIQIESSWVWRRLREADGDSDGALVPPARHGGVSLASVRQGVDLTQVQLAQRMAVSQRAISHVEHEPNPRVATVAAYVRALGGRLELRAVFPAGTVELRLADSQDAGQSE